MTPPPATALCTALSPQVSTHETFQGRSRRPQLSSAKACAGCIMPGPQKQPTQAVTCSGCSPCLTTPVPMGKARFLQCGGWAARAVQPQVSVLLACS